MNPPPAPPPYSPSPSPSWAGGALLLNAGEDPENKLVFFSAIDNVKFRKLIEPGDQIIFELELVKFRLRSAKLRGMGFVDGKLVVEADLMASIVDR